MSSRETWTEDNIRDMMLANEGQGVVGTGWYWIALMVTVPLWWGLPARRLTDNQGDTCLNGFKVVFYKLLYKR